jgi:hypothetical protein
MIIFSQKGFTDIKNLNTTAAEHHMTYVPDPNKGTISYTVLIIS